MSKKIVYNEIKARVISKVPAIKTFRLWNNQVSNENVENAFNYPAVFLFFSDLEYLNEHSALQTIVGTIKLYIVQEEYKTENEENLDFIDSIANALNGYQTDTIVAPLIRVTELQDTDHNNLIVWEQDYQFKANDTTSSKYNDAIEIDAGVVEPDLTLTFDIDNDNLKTGDGK
jgi:hypothetical protein